MFFFDLMYNVFPKPFPLNELLYEENKNKS